MVLDLSAGALVRAGGGLVLALVGVAIAALGRAKRRNVALGIALVPFGLAYVLTNLIARDSWTAAGAGAALLLRAVTVWAIALAVLADDRLRGLRTRVAAFAAAVFAVGVIPMIGPSQGVSFYLYTVDTPLGALDLATYFAAMASLLAYAAGLALASRRGAGTPGTTFLAAGLGLFPAFDLGTNLLLVGIHVARANGPLWAVSSWLEIIAVAAAAVAWLGARGMRRSYLVAWALLGSCLVGVGTGAWEARTGATSPMYGLVRIATAATLAYGIFRADLLGVPLPTLAARRGAWASVVLVGFFVVAQVAQEFLSDSMGVVLGGVAAGALLFAAVPLQRAAERALGAPERRLRVEAAAARGATRGAGDAFRAAVRAAMHDGPLSRGKERHLMEAAEHLGLGPADAHRILEDEESAARQGAR